MTGLGCAQRRCIRRILPSSWHPCCHERARINGSQRDHVSAPPHPTPSKPHLGRSINPSETASSPPRLLEAKATDQDPCFTRRPTHSASIAYDNARDVPPCQSLSLRFGKGYMHIYPRSGRLHHTRRLLASSLFVGLGRCRARFGCTPLGPTNRPEGSALHVGYRHRHWQAYREHLQRCICGSRFVCLFGGRWQR